MKHTILLIVLQLAATGADAYYTNRNWESAGHPHEINPIARPFVSTRGGRIAYFSATAALKIALPLELRKHGHPKLATVAAVLGIADNAEAAAVSANGLKVEKPQAGPAPVVDLLDHNDEEEREF